MGLSKRRKMLFLHYEKYKYLWANNLFIQLHCYRSTNQMKRQIKNAKKFNNRPRFFGLSPQFRDFSAKLLSTCQNFDVTFYFFSERDHFWLATRFAKVSMSQGAYKSPRLSAGHRAARVRLLLQSRSRYTTRCIAGRCITPT